MRVRYEKNVFLRYNPCYYIFIIYCQQAPKEAVMTQHVSASEAAYERRKTVIGVRMTVLYSIVYGGFVVLSVFRPALMGARALFGLNIAVAYGLGLILIAILFALVYNHLCRTPSAGGIPKDTPGT